MSSEKKVKVFVLDTNVLIHDPEAIKNFENNVVVVPHPVIVELDQLKLKQDGKGASAREVSRFIRGLLAEHGTLEGVPLSNGGELWVSRNRVSIKKLPARGLDSTVDHMIIATAKWWQNQENVGSRRPVILVTKDNNVAITASLCGLEVQDYTSDRVKDKKTLLYTGKQLVEGVEESIIDQIFSEGGLDVKKLGLEEPVHPNLGLIVRNGQKSALGRVHGDFRIRRVERKPVAGIIARNAEQTLALDLLLDPDISLVTISGKAGTGKTLLALAAAIERRRLYHQILVARPIVPLSNKDIGYLPGEIGAKIGPYMQPIYDNLRVIGSADSHHRAKRDKEGNGENGSSALAQKLLDDEKIVVTALAYIRGRSLNRVFFIVDEAQNLTPHEVKTIVTRAGEGVKIVFTGDIFQIDHPYLNESSNGLSYLIERMRGQAFYGHVSLEKGERSELAEIASHLL